MTSRESNIINIRPGSEVWHQGQLYTIQMLIDLKTVLAKSHDDGITKKLSIEKLSSTKQKPSEDSAINLIDVSDESWKLAQKRFDIIRPLLKTSKYHRLKKDVEERAKNFGVGISTLYRWIDLYESTGLMSALVRPHRSDRGRSRISPELEAIINDVIQQEYQTIQRIDVAGVAEEVEARCRKAKLITPHINTIRNRIKALPEALTVKKRHGRQIAKIYDPIRGHFPGADWPLAYVQIDHTPLDIILVDDVKRLPVGRPYITLALDVFSRMVTGFYLSFDPPSCFTVGMCIAHSVLPKDETLIEFGVQSDWPVQGKMKNIHADNALEFRSDILNRACDQHQMDLEWRPVREPQYGGHVERFFRTLNARIHRLPGTTFSSVEDREYYQSEKYSAFTLEELEGFITTFIVDKYHQKFHSEINMSPIKRFEQGVLGDSSAGVLGVGLPARIVDRESFRIDFMPYVKRTVQNYGMRNHKIFYYHDVLRPWVNAKDPDNKKKKRMFVFHYDPRDMSKYFFWDPELKRYYTIPYRDNRHPSLSLWELRAANKKARLDGLSEINEDLIFDTHERLKKMTADAVKKTNTERKKQLREEQRKRDHFRQMDRQEKIEKPTLKIVESTQTNDDDYIDIRPFDDIRD